MRALLLNLLLALVWLLLQPEQTAVAFVIGFALGFALLAIFRRVLQSADYVRRVSGLAAFAGIFTRTFLASCFDVMRISLRPATRPPRPLLLHYDVRGLTPQEILLLSHAITLTPGTATVEVAPDYSHLVLHALDAGAPEEVVSAIDRTLRRGILGFTR